MSVVKPEDTSGQVWGTKGNQVKGWRCFFTQDGDDTSGQSLQPNNKPIQQEQEAEQIHQKGRNQGQTEHKEAGDNWTHETQVKRIKMIKDLKIMTLTLCNKDFIVVC